MKLELPKYKASVQRALKPKEIESMKNGHFTGADKMYLLLLYYFGLRPGEALALMPSDFDFGAGLVRIQRSAAFNVNSPFIKDTKTGNVRSVPIPDLFVAELKKYIRELRSLYLIHNSANELMSKTSKDKMWYRCRKEINIRLGGDSNHDLTDGLRPYTFRHDYCTRLYYSGISMKKAAQLMGHSDIQMIMKVYAHLDDEKESLDVLRKMSI